LITLRIIHEHGVLHTRQFYYSHGLSASTAYLLGTVALEKATYRPGNIFWTAKYLTNAENAGGIYAEIGKHIALVCIHGEDIGRWWGTWEAMDKPER